jgi:hypothetical protein
MRLWQSERLAAINKVYAWGGFVLALLLTACSNSPAGDPYRVRNVIKDISFKGAHEDRRCSKSCRYVYVPDTWYILFCNVNRESDCFHRAIEHEPWSWQKVGTEVLIEWQPRTRYATIKSIQLVDGGQMVSL